MKANLTYRYHLVNQCRRSRASHCPTGGHSVDGHLLIFLCSDRVSAYAPFVDVDGNEGEKTRQRKLVNE